LACVLLLKANSRLNSFIRRLPVKSSKQTILLAVVFSVLAVIATINRPSEAQQGGAAPGACPGRYQLQTSGGAPSSTAFVIDTHTGQVWYRETNPSIKSWTELNTPVK